MPQGTFRALCAKTTWPLQSRDTDVSGHPNAETRDSTEEGKFRALNVYCAKDFWDFEYALYKPTRKASRKICVWQCCINNAKSCFLPTPNAPNITVTGQDSTAISISALARPHGFVDSTCNMRRCCATLGPQRGRREERRRKVVRCGCMRTVVQIGCCVLHGGLELDGGLADGPTERNAWVCKKVITFMCICGTVGVWCGEVNSDVMRIHGWYPDYPS
ncbi:hypothetical protein BKA63DRAFT_488870 [Paraphoma chrysanthemicola]|nr:hypothetical protein BKA63DRAFT_488870 [Paraphoma chrysanthemicola]